MPSRRCLSWVCVLVLWLTGCASTTTPEVSRPEANLTPEVVVQLPSPIRAVPLHVEQILTAQIKGQTNGHSLLVVMEADGQRLSLVGFSLLGVRLFRVEYGVDGIRVDQLPALAALGALPPANQVLADVLLSYWPRESWQAVLPAGWQLIDQPLRRELRDEKGELVSEITYQQQVGDRNPVRLWQHAFDYQLTIQTLPHQTSSNEAEDANRE
ncbi:DUF3261 domain-containing protein [Aeromonas caviae]|mgnify:CR=1 FL=1